MTELSHGSQLALLSLLFTVIKQLGWNLNNYIKKEKIPCLCNSLTMNHLLLMTDTDRLIRGLPFYI